MMRKAAIEKTPIFIHKKSEAMEKTQTPTTPNVSLDLGELLAYLSKCRGKLEVTFQKNENPEYESLCLVFIKIPVYTNLVSIVEDLLDEHENKDLPLSKGKIVIDKRDTNLYSLVSAIRIKSLAKLGEIVKPVLSRMKFILKEAIIINKNDNIGNLKK